MRRAFALAIVALASAGALPAPVMAQDFYSCRGYPPRDTLEDLRARVEAVRQVEREAAAPQGLVAQPYSLMLDQLRVAGAAIADPFLLGAEDDLKRCRNAVVPVRRTCAAAAAALVVILDQLSNGGDATRDARADYTQAMRQCERWTDLPPLHTSLRVSG